MNCQLVNRLVLIRPVLTLKSDCVMEKLELYIQIAKVMMMAIFLTVFLALVLLGKLTITIG